MPRGVAPAYHRGVSHTLDLRQHLDKTREIEWPYVRSGSGRRSGFPARCPLLITSQNTWRHLQLCRVSPRFRWLLVFHSRVGKYQLYIEFRQRVGIAARPGQLAQQVLRPLRFCRGVDILNVIEYYSLDRISRQAAERGARPVARRMRITKDVEDC